MMRDNFHFSPEIVVVPEISPLVFIAEAWIVPLDKTKCDRFAHGGGVSNAFDLLQHDIK